MALVKCPECGQEMSSEANICPHCGYRRKNYKLLLYTKLIILPMAIILILVFAINRFSKVKYIVESGSMEYTLLPGEQVTYNKLAYIAESTQRNDVVVIKYPDDESKMFIERIIGLPGETVQIIDGKVYINDSLTPLDDSYCHEQPEGSFGPYEVPDGYYFVLGDNRNHSADSRFWKNTYVSKSGIIGKVNIK